MKHLPIAFVAATLTFAALAPQAEAQAPNLPASQIEEIVVTAQKREQRLLDVGLSVTSISGDEIRVSKIEQLRDIAGFMPNVDIKEQVPGAIPVITIRGVGLDDFSTTNSPAAGIYVDEVPLSSLALMSFDLFDIERLEVLKGPQGTLYGRNSTAGAINIVTAKPKNEFEAYARAAYGSHETLDAEGMVNPVVSDWISFRVSGKMIRQEEGFWTSRLLEDGTPGERNFGERDILLGRVQAAFSLVDWIDVNLKLDGLRQRSELGQPEFFGTICRPGSNPIDPQNCTDPHLYSDTDGDPFTGDWKGKFPYDINQWGSLATANADLGFGTLTSVSGFLKFNRGFHIDADATPYDQFNFVQRDKVDQFTQEVRLAGDHPWVGWLFGAFYSWDESGVNTPGRFQDLIPGESCLILADQETQSAAAFANGGWHLTDALTFVTGLRFTWEEREYVGGTDWAFPVPGVISDTFIDESIGDENLSWKVGLEWTPLDDSLLYGSVSRGVKSGGFFSGVTTDNVQLQPYRPESLIAYEAGGKTQIFDGSVLLTAAGFYYDYTDVQTFMRNGSAPVQLVGNVPEAEIYGADLEALWLPLEGLRFQGGIGWLDTKLGAFLGPAGESVPEGNELANAPEVTFNILGRYEAPLRIWVLHGAIQADAHYSDAVFKEATNDPLIKADAYWVPNARLSLFDGETNRFEMAVFGRNLIDTQYVVQGLDVGTFGIGNRNYNAPRTIGGEIIYRFG